MAVTSGFFNSINGDRKYNARQIGMYLGKIIRSGVFSNPSTNLQVTAAGGMAVQVWPGRGMANCHWMDNDSMYTVILDDADLILDRIDAVVMRLDESHDAREVSIAVKKGAPASSPEAPAMERTEKVEEYCLAQIYVPKIKDDGTQEIIQANITDTRADTEVCGWVTSLIERVDTHTLFLQWQDAYQRYYDDCEAEFQQWMEKLNSLLEGDAAGQLLFGLQEVSGKVQSIERELEERPIKSTVQQAVIQADGWDGEESPFENEVEIEGITDTNVIEIAMQARPTKEQVSACAKALLVDGGQKEGVLTFLCMGEKPEIDLPITVIIRGDI